MSRDARSKLLVFRSKHLLAHVHANAPPPTFPGFTKGPGYEYPMAVVTEDASALVVVYSVNKEQIAATRVPLPVQS